MRSAKPLTRNMYPGTLFSGVHWSNDGQWCWIRRSATIMKLNPKSVMVLGATFDGVAWSTRKPARGDKMYL